MIGTIKNKFLLVTGDRCVFILVRAVSSGSHHVRVPTRAQYLRLRGVQFYASVTPLRSAKEFLRDV